MDITVEKKGRKIFQAIWSQPHEPCITSLVIYCDRHWATLAYIQNMVILLQYNMKFKTISEIIQELLIILDKMLEMVRMSLKDHLEWWLGQGLLLGRGHEKFAITSFSEAMEYIR